MKKLEKWNERVKYSPYIDKTIYQNILINIYVIITFGSVDLIYNAHPTFA